MIQILRTIREELCMFQKTIAFMLCLAPALYGQVKPGELKPNATKEQVTAWLGLHQVKAGADWEAVVKGTCAPIGFTTPEAKTMCEALMEGSPYREQVCRLAEPVAASPVKAEDSTPTLCQQAARLAQQFAAMRAQYAAYAAIAGAGCYSGMCPMCCAAAAGFAIHAAYYGTYQSDMQQLMSQNNCH